MLPSNMPSLTTGGFVEQRCESLTRQGTSRVVRPPARAALRRSVACWRAALGTSANCFALAPGLGKNQRPTRAAALMRDTQHLFTFSRESHCRHKRPVRGWPGMAAHRRIEAMHGDEM